MCALTAGPGVTNGMSAMASAQANHSPMVVLGGRAPAMRWGQGSLQEIDHVPFVRPLTKLAATAAATDEIPGLLDDAFAAALTPHYGPAFVDFPLDHVFMEAPEAELGAPRLPEAQPAAQAAIEPRRRAPGDRRAAGGDGRDRPLLGPRRAGARRAGRAAADPHVPQRAGPRLPARRPRAVLFARPLEGA